MSTRNGRRILPGTRYVLVSSTTSATINKFSSLDVNIYLILLIIGMYRYIRKGTIQIRTCLILVYTRDQV